jgi:hypothetical protein
MKTFFGWNPYSWFNNESEAMRELSPQDEGNKKKIDHELRARLCQSRGCRRGESINR